MRRMISFLIALAVAVVAVITLVDLFCRHLGWKAAGWAVLIIILPIIGSVIYWYVRPTSQAEVERAAMAHADLRRDPVQYGADFTHTSERDHF
jgi:uncharacterized protein (DUF58 family)